TSGSCTLTSAGAQSASCATTVTFTGSASGTISVSATYTPGGGDSTHITSQGSGSITVNKIATATAVSSSLNPSTYGQAVTFTATVTSGVGTPTGTVQFAIDGSNVGPPVTLDGTGKATFSTATLTVAGSPHAVTAVYAATANFSGSTGTLSDGQTVNVASTTTTAANKTATFKLSDQTVTLTATVTSSTATVGQGTVTF